MNIKQIVKKATKHNLKWLKTNYNEPMFKMDFIEKLKTQPNSKVATDYETGCIYLVNVNNHEYYDIITWLQIQELKHKEENKIIEKILENYKFSYMVNMRQAVYWLLEEAPKEILKKHEARIKEVKENLKI